MRPKYKLARAARDNLREISEYWAGEAGPDAALEVVSGIMETIITLSGQPRAGVAAERFGAGVRKFPAGKYMIHYRLYEVERNRDPARVSRGLGRNGRPGSPKAHPTPVEGSWSTTLCLYFSEVYEHVTYGIFRG